MVGDMTERVTIVIPARYKSVRFPGKPLIKIGNTTMVERVYRQCLKARGIFGIWVATDDKRIYDEVRSFSGNVIMTSPDHKSGTDRIVEASKKVDGDIFVNVQGDEPFIPPEMIEEVYLPLISEKSTVVSTLRSLLVKDEDIKNPNNVKVVVDSDDFALYFSRSQIPFRRDEDDPKYHDYYKHIGIYAYHRDFLTIFSKLKESALEKIEKLEQLRIIENGYKIKAPLTPHHSPGIDTPEDLDKVTHSSCL